MDQPDGLRKLHHGSIPLLGGLAVLPGLIWSLLAAEAGFIAAIALFYFALGLLDDLYNISARFRLILGGLVILLVLDQFPHLVVDSLYFTGSFPISLGLLALPFTCVCILGFVNSINMVDGINGLLVGLAALWTSFLLLHAAPHLTLSFIGFFGALVVTLAFNFKGKVFLGDSGACMLGAAIATAAIWVYNLSPSWQADGVVLLFAIPVVDCLRVMGLRILRGRSPMSPDRNHLHQLLVVKWPKGVLLIYWSLVGVPNVLSFWFPELTPIWLGMSLLVYAGLIVNLKSTARGPVFSLPEKASSTAYGNDD